MTEGEVTSERKHFYISYTNADQPWAEWIAMQLENAGYQTIIQSWDFRPGSNFVIEMDDAIKRADRTLLVLSPSYLRSDAIVDWVAAFREDPKGRQGRVLPVRVSLCNLKGLLGSIVPIDLVGLNAEYASQRLLAGVLQTRAKTTHAPFPGVSSSPGQTQFSIIPDAQFILWVQRIETMLRAYDYDTSYSTIDGILRNYYEDLTAQQRARLQCMQGLVYLRGYRPRDLLHPVIKSAGTLLSQAVREHPLHAYAAVLAAIEWDFAQTGLLRTGVDLDFLIGQAKKLRASDEDKAIIEIFAHVQTELYRNCRHFFSKIEETLGE